MGNPLYAQALKNINLSNPLLGQSLLNNINLNNTNDLNSLLTLQGIDMNSLLATGGANANPATNTTATGLNTAALNNALKINSTLPSTTALNFNSINNPNPANLEQLLAISQMINPTAISSTLDNNASSLLTNKLATSSTAANAANAASAAAVANNPYMYLNTTNDPSALFNILNNQNILNNSGSGTNLPLNLNPSTTTATTKTTTTVKPADLMPNYLNDTLKSSMTDNSISNSSSISINKPVTTTTLSNSTTSSKAELPNINLFKS